MSWRPDTERAPDGSLQMATSLSRVVGDDELAHTRTDVEDHSKVLGRWGALCLCLGRVLGGSWRAQG